MNRYVGFMGFLLVVGVVATNISQSDAWAKYAQQIGVSMTRENLSLAVFSLFALGGIISLPIYMMKSDNADDALEIAGAGIIGVVKWILIAAVIIAAIYGIGYFFGEGFNASALK